MTIIFLTSESTHHFFLINEVHKSYPVKKVFFQTVHQRKTPFLEKIGKLLNFKKAKKIIKAKIFDLLFYSERAREQNYERRALFNNATPSLDNSIVQEKITSFNNPETVKKIESENPDLIIVFGTEILKGPVLRAAKEATLNIHRGIVPQYRGGGMPSWVLYNNDFECLGVTIHLCTEKLDSGDIVGQAFYRLQKDDKMHTLRAKTTILAAKILKQVIEEYAHNRVIYLKQSAGKTWSIKDLTIYKEIVARKNLNKYLKSL